MTHKVRYEIHFIRYETTDESEESVKARAKHLALALSDMEFIHDMADVTGLQRHAASRENGPPLRRGGLRRLIGGGKADAPGSRISKAGIRRTTRVP